MMAPLLSRATPSQTASVGYLLLIAAAPQSVVAMLLLLTPSSHSSSCWVVRLTTMATWCQPVGNDTVVAMSFGTRYRPPPKRPDRRCRPG